jgi:hypothetical protein
MKTIKTVLAVSAAAAAVLAVAHASATTVVIPDPAPNSYIFFGNGDASVVYDGVTFTQQAALSNGNFYNVGVLFSGDPAVLSSQQQSVGVPNILITLPTATTNFSVDFGTFNGEAVTFTIPGVTPIVEGSTGAGYSTPDVFSVQEATPFTSVLITGASDDVLNINDITFGVPEPATWLLMLSGLGALGGVVRHRRHKALIAA